MALTQIASGLIASVAASTLTGTQTIPKATLPTGSVLQVVNVNYSTGTSTTSTSYVDTGLTATITPTSSTSKILVCVTQTLSPTSSGTSTFGGWICLRGSTQIYADARINMYMQYAHSTYSCLVLDSPATTSATTYKTQMVTGNASYTLEAQHASLRTSTISLLEIAA
jgi:hypothetical protein